MEIAANFRLPSPKVASNFKFKSHELNISTMSDTFPVRMSSPPRQKDYSSWNQGKNFRIKKQKKISRNQQQCNRIKYDCVPANIMFLPMPTATPKILGEVSSKSDHFPPGSTFLTSLASDLFVGLIPPPKNVRKQLDAPAKL